MGPRPGTCSQWSRPLKRSIRYTYTFTNCSSHQHHDTPSQARRLASLFLEVDDSMPSTREGSGDPAHHGRKLHLSKSPLSSRKDTQPQGTSVHLPLRVFNCTTVFTANDLEPIVLFFFRTVRWVNAPGMKVELELSNAPSLLNTVGKICINSFTYRYTYIISYPNRRDIQTAFMNFIG